MKVNKTTALRKPERIIRAAMEVNREIRQAILDLLKLCKQYQVSALSLNTALAAILQLPPDKRAELKPADLQAAREKARDQASRLVDGLSAGLERALSDDRDFLILLELYVRHPKHEQ
jgi:hypothetical protein